MRSQAGRALGGRGSGRALTHRGVRVLAWTPLGGEGTKHGCEPSWRAITAREADHGRRENRRAGRIGAGDW